MTPEEIAHIHAACFPARPWSGQEVADLLAQPATRLFFRDRSFLVVQTVPPEAEILTLATHPDARRGGHARHLLQEASRELTQAGVTDVHLDVGAGNAAALALYRQMGFVETGRRPAYYTTKDGLREDAVLMRAALPLGHMGLEPAN